MDYNYLGTDIIPFVFLTFVLFNAKRNNANTVANNLFIATIRVVLAMIAIDGIWWLIEGRPGQDVRVFGYLINIIYFVFSGLMSYMWLWYVFVDLGLLNKRTGRYLKWASIPLLILLVLSISTPYNHALFYLDYANYYRRGYWYWFQLYTAMGYTAAASVAAYRCYTKEVLSDVREQCLLIAAFPIFPIISAFIQGFTKGINTIMPCVSLSILMAYFNIQNRQISLDTLTGVNNRRILERYLSSKIEEYEAGSNPDNHRLYLLLLDIDKFKSINDSYGHMQGDEVLVMVAQGLKKAFASAEKAVISRYGGDEFIIVLEADTPEKVQGYIEKLHGILDEELSKINFSFDFSIGQAVYKPRTGADMVAFIEQADHNMYSDKNMKE